MKTQKIAHIVQHLKPGGLESLVLDMIQFSRANAVVISLEGTKNEAIRDWPKLAKYQDKLHFLNKQPGLQGSLLIKLHKLFNHLQLDVVHTHHIGPLLYAGVASRMAGIKHRIHTEHDAWHLHNPKRRTLESTALTLAQPIVVADAKKVSSQLQNYFPKQHIHTIVNGIDTRRFVPGDKQDQRLRLNLPLSKLLIGSAGRLETVKGHDQLISALRHLPNHTHLAIAGDGSQRESLEAQANILGFADRVHFVGHIEKIEHFYQALDVFCLPSRNEGYPLTALEAQACGIPTAVTNVGSAKETLCPNTGVLLAANNVRQMGATLRKMLLNLEAFSTHPRKFVCAENDIRKMVWSYEQLTTPNQIALR
ncbi:glycosyltransferase [Vibrio alfacsensis]|uniref:glycosyltransferase n=1 Tax=Vibrio alfacsensis TaxID=1074311 RepID=UPI002ADD75D2|nr:glycosyltransferase [Vibrio alfacsensis]WQE77435.1 glycosyltransferase [Vibrio alfacsensis]